ncbi:MAG: RsmD family RNA methyltransferase [Gemmatimonadota bacterium]|nr:RsmD family RNA methyltransferase [Gemmatimonadota bacterium]
MRIVGGTWAGRSLVSPGGSVRPTAEDVRARWMDLLTGRLEGARVLDLFAGSGALGLEAMSRGARWVDFVENGPASLHALKANVAALRLGRRGRIYKRDAIPFVEALAEGAYDLAFADPPYGSRKLDRVVDRWLAVPFCTVLAVEHERSHALPGRPRRHDVGGGSRISLYGIRSSG